MIPHKNYWPKISIAVNVKICVSPYFLCFSNLAPYLVPRIFMPLVDSLSKHPVCGSHNPRGGTPLYKLYRYVQTIQGRQRRGQSSGSVWSGIWRSTGRILTSADVCEGLLRNRPCKGQTIHAGDLKPSVTRVVIFPLSRVLLDGLRKKDGCS